MMMNKNGGKQAYAGQNRMHQKRNEKLKKMVAMNMSLFLKLKEPYSLKFLFYLWGGVLYD